MPSSQYTLYNAQKYQCNYWLKVKVKVKVKVKAKVKVVPVLLLTEHHAMKAYWGSGSIAPLIL
jgi:hypothetical protein